MLGGQGIPRRRWHGPNALLEQVGDAVRSQQAVNRSHAKIHGLAEQAVATLKTWGVLCKPRCSATWITGLVRAVLALHWQAQTEDGKAQ